MKYFWIIALLLLAGCNGNEELDSTDGEDTNIDQKDPLEGLSKTEAIEFHIRRQLSISVDEPIDYQVYEENCDGDDSLDAIITVNLLNRAVDEAIQSGKVAKKAAIGYMGNYNYIIYRDGFTGELSSALPIPSSPKAKLKVTFENIRSDKQKDILVDHRVLNAAYRNFFTITNGNLLRINQVKLFDALGTKDAVGYAIQYEPGKISSVKDIVSYVGTFKNPSFAQDDEVYTFEPQITKTNTVHEHWFFNPSDMKYYLEK